MGKKSRISSPPKERKDRAAGDSLAVYDLLRSVQTGEGQSTNELIQKLYQELRHLAASKLARRRSGQTLQATALVHEVYLRLLMPEDHSWQNQRHFFGAAAEAMRRILIDHARRKMSLKRGGGVIPLQIRTNDFAEYQDNSLVLDLHEALNSLEAVDPEAAELVKLRHYAGLTMKQIARIMEISPRTADNIWAFAKAWLSSWMREGRDGQG